MYILIYAYIYRDTCHIFFHINIHAHTHTRFYYMYLSIYLLSTWSICISFLHTHIYHIEHTHTHIYFQCIYTHALCIRSVYTHYTLYSMQTVPYVQYIYYTHTLSIPYIVYIVSLLYINYSNIFRLPTTYTVHYTLHILCLCICATSSSICTLYIYFVNGCTLCPGYFGSVEGLTLNLPGNGKHICFLRSILRTFFFTRNPA